MSARAPANDRCFDAIASINVMPNAVAPSAKEWNDIRANMILAKDFKGQIRGWHAFMTEGIDALFSCCHRAFDYLSADAQSARTSEQPNLFACKQQPQQTEAPWLNQATPRHRTFQNP
jgi:hypothetical protein